MQKNKRKMAMLRVLAGVILMGMIGLIGMRETERTTPEAKAAVLAVTPTPTGQIPMYNSFLKIRKNAFTKDEINAVDYSALNNDVEHWIGRKMYILYAVDAIVADAPITCQVYETATNTLVDSWTATTWTNNVNGRCYKHTSRELSPSTYKHGTAYTLRIQASSEAFNTYAATANFTTYNEISDLQIGGAANSYQESGSTVTLTAKVTGGKGPDYTFKWGYALKPVVSSMDEVTVIPGATSSSYSFVLGSESNNRYYFCGASDAIAGVMFADGVFVREKYKIQYNMGSYGNYEVLDTDYINCDATGGYTIPKLSPSLKGYEFKGWSADPSSTTPAYFGGNTFYPSSNLTLYAVWSYKMQITAASSVKVIYGKSADIITLAQIQPADAGYTYASSNPSVVSVSGVGVLRAKKYGTATITVKAAATETTEAATKKIKVQVKPPKVTGIKYKKKNGKTTITWKKLPGVKKYILYFKTKKDSKAKTWRQLILTKNKTVQTTNMKGYKIKVSAVGGKIEGECSKTVTIKK